MAHFKYDVVKLIKLIETMPCIWDKDNENFKNKIIRDESWQDIFRNLDKEYDELTSAEKKETGEMIMSKWSNVRDCYTRYLRTRRRRNTIRNYKFSHHLKFLRPSIKSFEINTNSQLDLQILDVVGNFPTLSPAPSATESVSSNSIVSGVEESGPVEISYNNINISKNKEELDNPEQIFVRRKKRKVDQNDHETLLLSFLPYIRDMSEIELMDLHINILSAIKTIKQNRISSFQM